MKRAISSIRVSEPPPRLASCFAGVFQTAGLLEGSTPPMPLRLAQSRLEKAFWTALGLVPSHAQAALKTFWTSTPALVPRRRRQIPFVMIEPAGSSFLPKNALAATSGLDFYFLHSLVSVAPTNILHCVVAHELSHAFLQAHRYESGTEEGDERDARTTVLAWGFSEEAVDTWAGANALLLAG